jgi:4-amino-4-deoxy-L-arabinose transferase-like glycosyltransferase
LALLLSVVVAGTALRVWALSDSAVEHFDEGVYASNLFFGPPDYAYPQQKFYAPPLLSALIEAGMIVGLAPNVAALLPSFLAGCGTIVALWWVGRSWFGAAVGLSAAALVAFADFHVLFSAAALTDALLGLWLVLAVDAMGRSLLAGTLRLPVGDGARSVPASYGWAIGAGIYTGLAWWTKYNGWLPLAIEAAALPVMWMLLRPPSQVARSWAMRFLVTAIVEAVFWSPYYLWLQSHGGYGPIAENHQKYFVGFAGWVNAAGRQLSNQLAVGSGWSSLGLLLAIFLPTLLAPVSLRQALWNFGRSLATTVGLLLIAGLFAVGLGAAIGLGRMGMAYQRAGKLDARWQRQVIMLALLAVWWCALLVATPLYAPYARLAMPCFLAACLAASMNWDTCLGAPEASRRELGHFAGWAVAVSVIAIWITVGMAIPRQKVFELPTNRRGLVRIAREVAGTREANQPRAIFVYGEPALFFQLCAAGEELVAPVATLPQEPVSMNKQPIASYLFVGPLSLHDAAMRQQLADSAVWRRVKRYEYPPSLLVWLDLHDPRRIAGQRLPSDQDFEMYEFIAK